MRVLLPGDPVRLPCQRTGVNSGGASSQHKYLGVIPCASKSYFHHPRLSVGSWLLAPPKHCGSWGFYFIWGLLPNFPSYWSWMSGVSVPAGPWQLKFPPDWQHPQDSTVSGPAHSQCCFPGASPSLVVSSALPRPVVGNGSSPRTNGLDFCFPVPRCWEVVGIFKRWDLGRVHRS